MVKRVDVAVQDLSKQALEGKFPGGKIIQYGIEENAIMVSDSKDNVSSEALKAVDEYTAKIKSGDQKVPSTRAELKEMGF